jgi:lactobin A/cerein 7B family class IIb bacteriocin
MTGVFEGNNMNSGIRELNAAEIEQVSGGVIPAAVWAGAKFCGYAFSGGVFAKAGSDFYDWFMSAW